jgi:ATP-dependent Lhr-like helicase
MKDSSSSVFEQYHPKIQRWIRRQGWSSLRSVQKRTAPFLLGEPQDVVITAATAGGKTEAAFFPIATKVAEDWEEEDLGAFSVLYVSPLKALINDQFNRLQELFSPLHVPVFRWHGDVSSSKKEKARERGGVLLITPESLEAQLIHHGTALSNLLSPLRFAVVDELHAFIGTERGRQLQSLLYRVRLAAQNKVPRVGLSATLGDMSLASQFLRPGDSESVEEIVDSSETQEVRIQVRGYKKRPPQIQETDEADEREKNSDTLEESVSGDNVEIAQHLFSKLRGGRHIVFADRRKDVEVLSDLLHRFSEREGTHGEFRAHHGSLSQSLREDAEERLQKGQKPTTVVATRTLELGIDVGSVESVCQVGAPYSVASLRQRLGRSGRRGSPSTMRLYVREPEITPDSSPVDRLRPSLVRATAAIQLLAEGWLEPPVVGALHLSTLVQQVLSLIAQHGGLSASQGYEALCEYGPFRSVSEDRFAKLLRDLGSAELIKQTHRGTLVLDLKGERLVGHYDFYAAFQSPTEYRLLAEGNEIGAIPADAIDPEDPFLIFAGQRWKVLDIDFEKKKIELEPAGGGKPPMFSSPGGPSIDGGIRAKMRKVYESDEMPRFLDSEAKELLEEGREAYAHFGLGSDPYHQGGDGTWWFPWMGDRGLKVFLLELRRQGFDVEANGPSLHLHGGTKGDLEDFLEEVSESGLSDPHVLASLVKEKRREKHHRFLRPELLEDDYVSKNLSIQEARHYLGDRV